MLNKKNLSKTRFSKALLSFIFFALLINLNCGKRKPPQPPVEQVYQRVEISGIQQGNTIILSWMLPSKNLSDKSTLNISRADVYRLAEPINSSLILSEADFASRGTLIQSLKISDEDFTGKQLTFTDTLQFAGQSIRLRYAIRLVNATGQKASFSNFILIEPTAKIAGNPTNLSAEIFEEEIKLYWVNPNENVDGSRPANILGFNIYRKRDDENLAIVLNNSPILDNNFSDRKFELGADYKYYVRTVSLGNNGEPVESLNSNTIIVNPKDIFAPSPPSAITIAAAPKNLSIFFAVNPEKDIAGYQIYRSSNPDLAFSEWTLLTKQLLTTNTFQDTNVEKGITYFYFIRAVDKTGNISEASTVVSETVP